MPTIDQVRVHLNRGRSWNDIKSATPVAAPAAMTAPTTMNAAYTQSEVQQLRTDVANLRATVASLLTAIQSTGFVG